MLNNKKEKIDVYLSLEYKKEIQKRAKRADLSISDYMKLKALDMLIDMSEIAGARSSALAQSKPAISEHAQKHAPHFSAGSVFDKNKKYQGIR